MNTKANNSDKYLLCYLLGVRPFGWWFAALTRLLDVACEATLGPICSNPMNKNRFKNFKTQIL